MGFIASETPASARRNRIQPLPQGYFVRDFTAFFRGWKNNEQFAGGALEEESITQVRRH
jgi:hypothetical protein